MKLARDTEVRTGGGVPSIPTTPLEAWISTKLDRVGQPLNREALSSYQLERLNQTISLVQERSPFYQKLLGKRHISLARLEDLTGLPFTTAEDLRLAPLSLLCVSQDEVERIVTLPTSGTTGQPKRIFFTAEDQELTRDFFHWGMSTLVEPGDRVLILLPGSLPGSVGDLLKDGLAQMNVEGITHGPVADARHTLEVIENEQVTALVGIPVQVLWLARLSAAQQSHRSVALKSVLLSTDRVPLAIARTIEETWGCAVYNHYGMTEMGLGGGVDCRARTGYHLREADLLFEVVDPATGRPVPEGEPGEVVFTTLTRQAMPLLRYRTGDLSRFIPEACPCGTVLKRLAHIDERLAGGIQLRDGQIIRQRDFDEALFAVDGLADFRVLFARGKEKDSVVVRVRHWDAATQLSKDEIARALSGISSFWTEVTHGRISVELLDWDDTSENRSGTGKRTIVHREETAT